MAAAPKPTYLLRFSHSYSPINQHESMCIEYTRELHLHTTSDPEQLKGWLIQEYERLRLHYNPRCRAIAVAIAVGIGQRGSTTTSIMLTDRRGPFCTVDLLPIGTPITL